MESGRNSSSVAVRAIADFGPLICQRTQALHNGYNYPQKGGEHQTSPQWLAYWRLHQKSKAEIPSSNTREEDCGCNDGLEPTPNFKGIKDRTA